MLPEEVATLKREITKDVLDKVAFVLQKMGAPIVDLANMIVEDQESQLGDPKALIEWTPEPTPKPITFVVRNPTPQRITTISEKNHICCAIYAAVLQRSSIKFFLKKKIKYMLRFSRCPQQLIEDSQAYAAVSSCPQQLISICCGFLLARSK